MSETCFDVVLCCEPLKCKAKFGVDDNLNLFFLFSEKTSLDISCELSAWQTIHMKCQNLFSLANKKIVKTVVCPSCHWRFKG